ncbi:hypothetical protein VTL71DRAFT_15369 [Oculimacula yallundae]|uniref:Uncharacterized protein n=1 Tax=Oculimacula yallundae TaxID=86028 RepID=A0ABR4CIF7_9HELO
MFHFQVRGGSTRTLRTSRGEKAWDLDHETKKFEVRTASKQANERRSQRRHHETNLVLLNINTNDPNSQ